MEEKLLALMDEYGLREPAVSRWQVLIQSFSAVAGDRARAGTRLPLIFLGNPTVANIPSDADYAVGIGPSFGASINAAWVKPRTQLPRRAPVHGQHRREHERGARRRRGRHVHGFSDVLIAILGPRKATGLQGALDAKHSA